MFKYPKYIDESGICGLFGWQKIAEIIKITGKEIDESGKASGNDEEIFEP